MFLQQGSLLSSIVKPSSPNLSAIPGINVFGAALVGVMFVMISIAVIIYIYLSIAFQRIGKKAGLQNPQVSWLSPLVTIFEVAKAHFWPFPFLIIGYSLGYLIIMAGTLTGSLTGIAIFTILGGIIIFISLIVFGIMTTIWLWKTFEAIGKPGWWAIICPIIGIIGLVFTLGTVIMPLLAILGILLFVISGIVFLVLVGIAAFGN